MLEYRKADISYDRELVLRSIDVAFPPGQITAVVGPNGCGKTTLLQCLAGGSKLTGGQVLLDGRDFFAQKPVERARQLAFLPQIRYVIPALPVRVLVEHGRFPYMGFGKRPTETDREMVRRAMEYTQILPYANRSVDTLSGGIRQRAFLALTLAQDTPCLVLDEPTTFLDLKGQKDFLALIRGLRAARKTVILVLHDLNQALDVSDHLVVMKDRRILQAGPREQEGWPEVFAEAFEVTCRCFSEGGRNFYFFE